MKRSTVTNYSPAVLFLCELAGAGLLFVGFWIVLIMLAGVGHDYNLTNPF